MRDEQVPFFRTKDRLIDTSSFSNLLHDEVVGEFEREISAYVGAKYCCSVNSATSAIFLILLGKKQEVSVPSMIPPVVLNAILTSGNSIKFRDDVNWIGNSYVLHDFGDYKVIDSAQKIEKNQFIKEANSGDLMFFSHYPTKPIGSCDGGTIVSNDPDKIEFLRKFSFNGMSSQKNNWERSIELPGYKMYMNSIQSFMALESFRDLEKNKEKIKDIREIYNQELGLNNKSEHLYRILVDDNQEFIKILRSKNIVCGIHYSPQHKNPIYTDGNFFDCPLSEEEGKRTVSLPFFPDLQEWEQDKVIREIKKII